MQVKPLSDRVLVERLEEERKTAAGIIIPDSNTEKPSEGKIVSVAQEELWTMEQFKHFRLKKGIRFFLVSMLEQRSR